MYPPDKKMHPPGPYSRSMLGVLGGSYGGGRFLMGEVPLYLGSKNPAPPRIPRGGTRLWEYRGASLIRKRLLLGPYSRAMPRALWWS